MAEYSIPTVQLGLTLDQQLGSDISKEILALLAKEVDAALPPSIVTDYAGGPVPVGTDIVYLAHGFSGPIGNELADAAVIIAGGNGATQITLNGGVDRVIELGGGADTVKITGNTSEIIKNVGAGDNVDTGAGFDKVIVSGALKDYTQVMTDHGVQLIDAAGKVITISNAEFIQFSDGSVMINAQNVTDATLAKFYDVIFHRDADWHGADYWFKADDTTPISKIADMFIHSQEFTTKFGSVDTMSNSSFVSLMYQNAFGRAPDAGGLSYWTNALQNGVTKSDLVIFFAASKEESDLTANTIHTIPGITS